MTIYCHISRKNLLSRCLEVNGITFIEVNERRNINTDKKKGLVRMEKRGIVFVFPSRRFVPSLHKAMDLRKLAGVQTERVHHIYLTRGHSPM